MPEKVWTSPAPTKCDLCEKLLEDTFIDAKTKQGPWGCLCMPCFAKYGVGLGVGRGQMYRKQTDGSFLKIKG